MSCCRRASGALSAPTRWAASPAVPAPAPAPAPAGLRFAGAHALSLPLPTRRLLVRPGETVEGVTAEERAVLWRTGLFSAL